VVLSDKARENIITAATNKTATPCRRAFDREYGRHLAWPSLSLLAAYSPRQPRCAPVTQRCHTSCTCWLQRRQPAPPLQPRCASC